MAKSKLKTKAPAVVARRQLPAKAPRPGAHKRQDTKKNVAVRRESNKLPVSRKIDATAVAAKATKKLATLTDVRDIKRFADDTERMKKIVGVATGKRTDINKIARPWLAAIVKAGRILQEMAEAGKRQGRGGDQKSKSHGATLKLPELGFTKSRSARWQLAGQLPDDEREKLFSKIENSSEGILTFSALAKAAAAHETKNRRNASRAAKPLVDGRELRIGDCRKVLADVADNSVPLILTDLPYGDEAEPLYRWLAEFAARVLTPGGSLICYTGQSRLNRDIKIFDEHLVYWWLEIMMHHQSQRIAGKFVIAEFKPVLWYVKDHRRGRSLVPDILRPPKREKDAHDWGQGEGGVTNLIEHLTDPGELIVDPFAGTGTWGEIAASMGRRWLGADLVEGGTATVEAGMIDDEFVSVPTEHNVTAAAPATDATEAVKAEASPKPKRKSRAKAKKELIQHFEQLGDQPMHLKTPCGTPIPGSETTARQFADALRSADVKVEPATDTTEPEEAQQAAE